jgi:hypothetical protein
VIIILLSNLFLHVVFDGWMQNRHPEKPFERYADDIVVHCKTQRQAQFMLECIPERMSACGLSLHPSKTRIVNLRGKSEKRFLRKYDFLGFTLRPVERKIKGRWLLMPGTFMSSAYRRLTPESSGI